MPQVPYLGTTQVQAEALPGRANPRIDDSVNPAAFGTPIAQGIDTISQAQTEEQARQKVQNDNLRVIDANTQLEAGRNALLYGQADPKTGQMTGGAFSLKGLDAMNMPAKLVPQYQDLAGKISDTLTPDQQRLFHGHVAAGGNELNLQLSRYEYEQSNQLAQAVYTNAGAQAVESASVGWRDPAVIGKSRADIKALVQMQGDRDGWPQAERDAQTQKLLAEMHYSVIDRMLADGKPDAALAYFVGTQQEPGVRDSRELTGAQSHQLGAAIDQAVRQAGTQNQAAVAGKVRDVRAAALNGQLIPPSAMPTEAELRTAYPDTWADVTDAINADVRMGADLKTMSAASPEQISAMVNGYKPSSVLGASEQYARYNDMQAAAARVLSERARDPRQYALDNHLGSAPLDLNDPKATGAELQSRLAALPGLSKQLGGAVPLLSKNEAAALSQSFQGMKPTDQLRTLNTLANAIGDDRGFQMLMRQILPGSPVPAVVGNQVVSANPNTPPVWFDRQFAVSPTDQARILQGNELLNPNTDEKGGKKAAFPMPAEGGSAGLRQQFSQKVGDLFRGRPELGETYYQAFKGAYASLLSDAGDVSGNGSSRLRDQALQIALGHITRFNGQDVSVPQGMDPTRFEGLVNNAVVARAKQLGAPEGFEGKLRGYTLQEVDDMGSGRYRLMNGSLPLVRPDGQGPFEIDLRGDYLPSHAHGSPEDIARTAKDAPAAPPQTDSLAGNSRVPNVTPHDRALTRPPPAHAGAAAKGSRAHPSQAPEL